MPTTDFNRRKFLGTKLSAGFAAATLPITAQTALANYRPGYNKAAAEDGSKKMLAWFQRHGVA